MIHWLAQRDVTGGWSDQAREQFNQGTPIPPEVFYVIFGALALFLLVRWLLALMRAMGRRVRPLLLFGRVTRQLGIGAGDRWWLWRTARRCRLESPMTLLMSPATFDHYLEQVIGDDENRSAAVRRRRGRAVAARLFGDAAGAPADVTPA